MSRKPKVLIVNNRPENLVVLRQTLASVDADLVEAASGSQTLSAALEHEFALAVIDLPTPGINGFDVARLLHEDPKCEGVPIIFLTTSSPTDELVHKDYESREVDYIVKPYPPSVLLSKVRVFLSLHACRAQSEDQRELLEQRVRERTAALTLEIEERKTAEGRAALHARLLGLINRPQAQETLIRDILIEIKTFTGFDAVGIRLREGDDYPYFEQTGFSDEFVHLENSLLPSKGRDLCKDAGGTLRLECTCGLVISGATPKDHPLFTSHGSFWSSNVRPLLDLPPADDPRRNPRNHCIHTGYQSVALIPLRSGEQIVGLLQLNDRSAGRLSLDLIRFLEEVSVSVGIALARLRSEFDLRESRTLLAAMADNYPNSYLSVIEDDLRIGMTSGREFKTRGLDPVTYVGLTPEQIFGEHAGRVRDEYVKTFQGEERAFELLFDGQHQLCRTVPLRSDDGSIPRILVVAENITERKRAEQELQESRTMLATALSSMTDPVFILGSKGELKEFNDAYVTYHRYKGRAGASSRFTDSARYLEVFLADGTVVPPEMWAGPRALSGETRSGVEYQLRCKDTGDTWFGSYSFAPLRNQDGEIVGAVVVARDITERKRAEAALRTSEMKHRVLYESSNDAIVTLAPPSWRFTSGNPAALKMFAARDEADFTRRALWECSPEVQPDGKPSTDKAREMIEKAMGEGSHYFEWTHRRLTGEDFPATVSLTRFELEGQALLQATVRDITVRKRVEQERESLQAGLAQSDRLSSMGMLAASVAHEINNPLTYVIYHIEFLNQGLPKLAELMKRCHAALTAWVGADGVAKVLDDKEHLFVEASFDDAVARLRDTLSGTQRIKSIARSLGTFSRVEHKEVTPVNIHQCIEHAVGVAFNELKYRARLVKDLGNVPPVLASDGKLAQVFLNLLINAGHAIPEGYVDQNEIRVRTWYEGDWVFAEVSDTGKGIAPEHRDKIFRPFYTTKGVGVGTGLGLSICKKIVEGFGGEISFTCGLDRGTTFLVRLPKMPRNWRQIRGDSKDVGPDGSTVRATVRGRVLVVDDEAGIRGLIVSMLKADHEVVTVCSGAEGRALLKKDNRFDVILCDLMMPGMSGMDLHAWLADHDSDLAERVVFITGGTFTPGASEYLEKVGNLLVEKPFDTQAFRKMTNEKVALARSKGTP